MLSWATEGAVAMHTGLHASLSGFLPLQFVGLHLEFVVDFSFWRWLILKLANIDVLLRNLLIPE